MQSWQSISKQAPGRFPDKFSAAASEATY